MRGVTNGYNFNPTLVEVVVAPSLDVVIQFDEDDWEVSFARESLLCAADVRKRWKKKEKNLG